MGLLSKALQPYSGPYKVTSTDLEIAVKPRSFGTAVLASTGEPALQLDTVLCTLFAPAQAHKKGSGHQQWLQRPLGQTSAGFARFVNKPQWMLRIAFLLFAARTKLPAEIDVPPADRLADIKGEGLKKDVGQQEMRERSEGGDAGVGASSMTTLVDEEGNRFPLIVFSHGLGGGRTTYSQYCGELASLGFVVAAIEHRDGSGPISVVRLGDGKERVVNYIKPDDLRFDPPNRQLSQLEHRKEQIEMRLAEIDEVLALITRINDGDGAAIAAANLREQGRYLPFWKGRIDVKNAVMAGHSFGGATSLQALRAGSRFPFTSGIALDPWLEAIPPYEPHQASSSAKPSSTPTEQLDIKVPLLAINSEAFTLWSSHWKLVRNIVKGVEGAPSWFFTLVGSIHLSFSDFPLIQPYIARKSGARIDPKVALSSFVEASKEFLLGEGTEGELLGQQIVPGDEEGLRPGEGYEKAGKHPMETVGDMRIHVRPE